MRLTSINAYNRIKDEGLLSQRRLEVYQILYQHGPLTANEIVRKAKESHPNVNQTGFNARLSELKRMKVVAEVGDRHDEVSGHRCLLWDVTDGLPSKLVVNDLTRKHLLKCREVLQKVYVSFPEAKQFIDTYFKGSTPR